MHRPTSHAFLRGAVAATALAAVAAAGTVGVTAWGRGGANSAAARTSSAAVVEPSAKPPVAVLDRARDRQAKQAARAAYQRAQRLERAARTEASRTVDYDGDPRGLARGVMAERYGWGGDQFSCLDALWQAESGWQVHAANPSSGAYGIPQALPGSKMAEYGADWQDNPLTQIEWGLAYIDESYGTPCGAWSTFRSKGWY